MGGVEVHLVRHGQSTWNVEKRLQGQTAHPPLTARGRDDAARAAAHLAGIVGNGAVQIISSDLVRASQTADIIAAELTGSGAVLTGPTKPPPHPDEPPRQPITFSAALREQHLGDMEGRLTRDLKPLPTPDGLHISEVRWGGGESLADVHARLRSFFDAALPSAPRHLVVVTHGDTLRVARAVLTGHSHRDIGWDIVPNGAVVSVACPQLRRTDLVR